MYSKNSKMVVFLMKRTIVILFVLCTVVVAPAPGSTMYNLVMGTLDNEIAQVKSKFIEIEKDFSVFLGNLLKARYLKAEIECWHGANQEDRALFRYYLLGLEETFERFACYYREMKNRCRAIEATINRYKVGPASSAEILEDMDEDILDGWKDYQKEAAKRTSILAHRKSVEVARSSINKFYTLFLQGYKLNPRNQDLDSQIEYSVQGYIASI